MGVIHMRPGGSSDLDVITATAADVRRGKVIVDKDGNPLTGIMAEQAGGTYTPGTANKTLIPANTFATSDVIMKGDPNLIAANLKKGVTIMGITGTFEGWVPTPQDLYYNGVNSAGFTFVKNFSNDTMEFQAQQIVFNIESSAMQTSKSIDITGITKLIISGLNLDMGSPSHTWKPYVAVSVGGKEVGKWIPPDGSRRTSFEVPINSAIQRSGIMSIAIYGGKTSFNMAASGTIKRISLA